MPYTLRLYFSGLCFFDLVGETPSDPVSARVLLVNAVDKNFRYPDVEEDDVCVHMPRLVVRRRNILKDTREPSEIRPGPDGEDLAIYDLRRTTMRLQTAKDPSQKKLKVERYKGSPPLPPLPNPSIPEQETWFDWTAPVKALHSKILRLHPEADQPGTRATSILNLDDGALRTMEVGRQNGQMLKFEYRRYDKSGGPVYSEHAMTDRVLLEIHNLTKGVTLEFDDDGTATAVELWAPDESILKVSITNLCGETKPKTIQELTDFLWFYNLFAWENDDPPPAADLIIPVVVSRYGGKEYGIMTPSTGSCPPATLR